MAAILPSVVIVFSVLHHLPSLSPLVHLSFIPPPPPPLPSFALLATIIIDAETHKTALTAVTIMHMLTHIFQGQPGHAQSACTGTPVTFDCIHIFEHNKVDVNKANVEKKSNQIDFL